MEATRDPGCGKDEKPEISRNYTVAAAGALGGAWWEEGDGLLLAWSPRHQAGQAAGAIARKALQGWKRWGRGDRGALGAWVAPEPGPGKEGERGGESCRSSPWV